MSISLFKITAAFLTLITAIIGGLLPIWHTRKPRPHHSWLNLGQAFASGIFLGAALLHMLPDAADDFHSVYPHIHFPLANLIAALGFVSLLFFEHFIERLQQVRQQQPQSILHYLLVCVLSIHCFIEGTALGVNLTLSGAFVIFIAIIAHKGLEGFAISMKLIAAKLQVRSIIYFVLFVAIMTPLGIGVGEFASAHLQNQGAMALEGVFNAFAAGSFLYIATMHTLGHSGCAEEHFGRT